MAELTKNAAKGRRILNESIKRDYARLLRLAVTPDDEVDFEEIEELANKYRFYFDENGEVKELASKGVDYTAKRPTTEQMRKSAIGGDKGFGSSGTSVKEVD